MIYIKKKIKINQTETGEYTIEEIIEKYKPFIKKTSFHYLTFLKGFGNHSLHVELEDLEQLMIIGIVKAYNSYSIEYQTDYPKDAEDYNENDPIGFFPYMEKTAVGEVRKFCRDTLKTRRKDYNIQEIKLNSLNEPASSSKDDGKENELIEIVDIEDKNLYEEVENKMIVDNLLSILSEKDRKIIELYYYDNLSQDKISSTLNTSQAQVSRIIKASIKKLKQYAKEQEKREYTMAKTKSFEFNMLIEFLINGAKEYSTLDDAIKAFCNKVENVSKEDVYLSLNKRKASYENMKVLYTKEKTSTNVETISSSKTVSDNETKKKSITSYKSEDIKPKTIEEKPVMKSINLDVLKEVNIVNLTADVNDIRVEFTPKGINLYNIQLKELSEKDLIKLQENIRKVIEINNTIYK